MKNPDFLVIGGMKCATTTLHADLTRHSSIECGRKELNALTRSDDLKQIGEIYQQNYRHCNSRNILGDVSTTYSMLPDHVNVANKAKLICGEGLKIIYVVRDPVRRAISHHQHMMNHSGPGKMGPDINQEILTQPSIIAYSCYSTQLEPWIEAFTLKNVLVIRFEDYVSDRQGTLGSIFDFLNVRRDRIEIDDEGSNRGSDRRVAKGLVSALYRTDFFRNFLQPATPMALRAFLRSVLLKKAVQQNIEPGSSTIQMIINGVSADAEQLRKTLMRNSPLWDLEQWRQP